MKISFKKSVAVIVSLLTIASLIYFVFPPHERVVSAPETSTDINYGSLGQVVFKVEAAKIKRRDLILSVNANGIVRARREISVVSNLSGIITKLNVYEGKKVDKGDLLVKLDDREYKLSLKEAEAALLDAKVEYALQNKRSPIKFSNTSSADSIKQKLDMLDRNFAEGKIEEEQYKKLREQLDLKYILTGVMRQDVLRSKSGLTSALNNTERAKLNLSYTRIQAPFQGVIGNVDLTVGQRISAGNELFKLLDISELLIETGVLESEAAKMKKNAVAKIYISSFYDKVFDGYVKFVSPIVNPETKTCRVIVAFKDEEHKVKPGMYAEVKIEVERLKNRLLAPKEALLVRDNRNLMFMAEDSLAKWNYVEIGKENDQFVEIIKGKNQPVNVGDLVLIEGHFTLDHDAKIKIVDVID